MNVKGHSFYLSIKTGTQKDQIGSYDMSQLLVYDPGLLPFSMQKEGIPMW